tara:strand:- start:325 stop:747 length:423 start_codon:yes stop_codon:yes gene_type:complete
MFNFLKKEKNQSHEIDIISKTASLLIHMAKIDENYSEKEKAIIEKTIIELGAASENISQIMENAEKNEQNSNQILDFTKDIKNTDQNFKIKIIESLWKIIYSDKNSDMYESNLMRRLSGLLYLDNKVVGDIKEKIKKSFE